MKEIFLEPEIEIVSFESLDNICGGGETDFTDSIPGDLWDPEEM